MAPGVKIALVQFQPKPLSPEANFQYAAAEIRLAAVKGAHIAVLPEYHLTSWVPSHPDFIACCAKSTDYLSQYQTLARELNIHIVPGTIISPVPISQPHPEAPPSTASPNTDDNNNELEPITELHNIAHFIEATTGTILSSYQKHNLWHVERGILTPGTTHTPHQPFDVLITLPNDTNNTNTPQKLTFRIALLICWDLAFPESFRPLTTTTSGAQLIIIPSFWHISQIENTALKTLNPRSEEVFLDSVTVARAFENTCAVALCNAWGCSQVAVPVLGSIEGGRMGVDEVGMRVVEVDLGGLEVAEAHYRVRRDLRGGGLGV